MNISKDRFCKYRVKCNINDKGEQNEDIGNTYGLENCDDTVDDDSVERNRDVHDVVEISSVLEEEIIYLQCPFYHVIGGRTQIFTL